MDKFSIICAEKKKEKEMVDYMYRGGCPAPLACVLSGSHSRPCETPALGGLGVEKLRLGLV